MIRPEQERTDIISLTSGIIDSIYVQEGQVVSIDQPVVRLKNYERNNQLDLLDYELGWRKEYIHDLRLLCSPKPFLFNASQIKNPVLRQQYFRFIHSDQELVFSLNKAQKEFDIAAHLAKEKVIAYKELFDKENELNRLSSARAAFLNEQPILWEQDLAIKQQELKQFESRRVQLLENEYLYIIKSPVQGTIQNMDALYRGSVIPAGHLIGKVSPDVELIAECFAGPRDIGLLIPGQDVRYQMDAFDYKYFGILSGKVLSIDNDYTVINQRPVYKIRCSISTSRVQLKNGYAGQLKKGMSLQARFIVTERTLWQLLWDQLDDWLNPVNHLAAE